MDQPVQIVDGLAVEYHPENVIIYRITSSRRAIVDAWLDLMLTHDKEALASNRHLRRIFDMRKGGYPSQPPGRNRSQWSFPTPL